MIRNERMFPMRVGSTEMVNTSDEVLFGPIGEDAYPPYARAIIRGKFGEGSGNVAKRAERMEMWKNYELQRDALRGYSGDDIVLFMREYLMNLNPIAKAQFEVSENVGLGGHLREIEKFCREFLLDEDNHSRFPQIIGDRNARIVESVVAPIHDLAKFLSSPGSQVIPDHEVMIGVLVRDTFAGKRVSLGGEKTALTPEDVDFIAGVVGDHENIYKESGRRDFMTANSPIKRAKALFFIADTLTGAIERDQSNSFHQGGYMVDHDQLERRFTDLARRHCTYEKEFRPEWVVATVSDLLQFIAVLKRQPGVSFVKFADKKNIEDDLIESGIGAIEQAKQSGHFLGKNQSAAFTTGEIKRLEAAKDQLKKPEQLVILNRLVLRIRNLNGW